MVSEQRVTGPIAEAMKYRPICGQCGQELTPASITAIGLRKVTNADGARSGPVCFVVAECPQCGNLRRFETVATSLAFTLDSIHAYHAFKSSPGLVEGAAAGLCTPGVEEQDACKGA